MILCVPNMQFETIAAGVIVGLGGQAPQNNTPTLNNTNFAIPPTNPPADADPDDTKAIKCKWFNFLHNIK